MKQIEALSAVLKIYNAEYIVDIIMEYIANDYCLTNMANHPFSVCVHECLVNKSKLALCSKWYKSQMTSSYHEYMEIQIVLLGNYGCTGMSTLRNAFMKDLHDGDEKSFFYNNYRMYERQVTINKMKI